MERDGWLKMSDEWQEASKTMTLPRASDLLYGFVVAFVLTILRYVLYRFVFTPLAHYVMPKRKTTLTQQFTDLTKTAPKLLKLLHKNSSHKKKRAVVANQTDSAPSTSSSTHPTAESISQETNLSLDQVKGWLREQRRNEAVTTALSKFNESCWRWFIYSSLVITGLYVLTAQPFFYNLELCWFDYPRQELPADLKFYYLAEMGFYIHELVAVFFHAKKRDFWEMVVHHVATLFLVGFSYVANFMRMGSIMLLLHDLSDPFLEAAKLFNYAKKQTVTDLMFVCFAVVFTVARMYFLPAKVMVSTYNNMHFLTTPFGFRMAFGFMLLLQVLHVYWNLIICKMVYKFVVAGQVSKDDRSETDSDADTHQKQQ